VHLRYTSRPTKLWRKIPHENYRKPSTFGPFSPKLAERFGSPYLELIPASPSGWCLEFDGLGSFASSPNLLLPEFLLLPSSLLRCLPLLLECGITLPCEHAVFGW
jgi:hypothetical protein